MIVDKIFSIHIDFKNDNEFYSAEIDSVVLRNIKLKYERKCFNQTFILEVVEIVQMSDVMIKHNTTQCDPTVDVSFRAKCIVFTSNNIVCDCVVRSVGQASVEFDNEFINGILVGRNKFDAFEVGMMLPMMVGSVSYPINGQKINMQFKMLDPANVYIEKVLFKVDKTRKPQTENVLKILKSFNDTFVMLKTMHGENRKAVEFFMNMVYPLTKKHQEPKGYKYVTMDKPAKYIVSSVRDYDDISKFDKFLSSDAPFERKDMIELEDGYDNIMIFILQHRINYMNAIMELVKNYPNADKIKSTIVFWNIYNSSKLDYDL